jgi:hypothetical protein
MLTKAFCNHKVIVKVHMPLLCCFDNNSHIVMNTVVKATTGDRQFSKYIMLEKHYPDILSIFTDLMTITDKCYSLL